MHFEIGTSRREVLVDITDRVAEAVRTAGVADGIAIVSSPHTTAGITVNENADPDVARDLLHGLERLFPRHGEWRHAEGNSDAHLKTACVGTSATLPIEGGRLLLGTWQAVYFAEFDGPRNRRFDVTIVAGIA
jgi:secondary thiamine-phosphate synthase enzyme